MSMNRIESLQLMQAEGRSPTQTPQEWWHSRQSDAPGSKKPVLQRHSPSAFIARELLEQARQKNWFTQL
jgi:hypothetical protein